MRITATEVGLQRSNPLTLIQEPHETTQLNLKTTKAQRAHYLVVNILFFKFGLLCLGFYVCLLVLST
jgi:hypothetical protein